MTISVDFTSLRPRAMRPEILQHPMIPSAMARFNPRTILGKGWWDETRRKAYHYSKYHCLACAGAPDDDPYGHVLEAHECYDIDWEKATSTYTETVALCWSCHRFIHAGRLLAMLTEGARSREQVEHVLKRGLHLLSTAGLRPYWRTWVICRIVLDGVWEPDAVREANKLGMVPLHDVIRAPSHMWKLVIDGKEYRP